MASVSAANGCRRAARNASRGLVTVSVESSAHRHSPLEADQNPCRTNIDFSLSSDAARLASEGKARRSATRKPLRHFTQVVTGVADGAIDGLKMGPVVIPCVVGDGLLDGSQRRHRRTGLAL